MSSPKRDADKLEPVMIRMPSDLHDAIKAKAESEERSMAGTIRHALRLYVSGV
jgi:hypothetical protein